MAGHGNRFTWGPGDFYLDGDLATEEWSRARIALAEARKTYPAEVERVAAALRAELESGELREWRDGDGELPPGEAPYHRLEDEVALRYVATLDAALVVLAASPHAKDLFGADWRSPACPGIAACATNAMASDVLDLVRARGWLR